MAPSTEMPQLDLVPVMVWDLAARYGITLYKVFPFLRDFPLSNGPVSMAAAGRGKLVA